MYSVLVRTRSTLACLMLWPAACGRIGFDATLDASQGAMAPGCLTTERPGPFSTDFALGAPTWGTPYNEPSIGLTFLDGAMEVTPAGSPAPSYGGMISSNDDFRNRRVFVDLPVMVNTATSA